MSQTVIVLIGALLGGIAWLVLNETPYVPSLFLSTVIGAWAGLAIYALITGKVTIAGRGGKSPKVFSGVAGRLVGLLILLLAFAFGISVIQMQ